MVHGFIIKCLGPRGFLCYFSRIVHSSCSRSWKIVRCSLDALAKPPSLLFLSLLLALFLIFLVPPLSVARSLPLENLLELNRWTFLFVLRELISSTCPSPDRAVWWRGLWDLRLSLQINCNWRRGDWCVFIPFLSLWLTHSPTFLTGKSCILHRFTQNKCTFAYSRYLFSF